jgi:hypothetical protein
VKSLGGFRPLQKHRYPTGLIGGVNVGRIRKTASVRAKALDRFVEGSVCPNTNEGLAQRSPVLTNARAHAPAADRLEIAEFIAQSVALHSQGCIFSLDVTDNTKLVYTED